MKISRKSIGAVCMAVSVSAASLAWAGEKDDAALAKAPAAVQAAARKALGDKKLEEFGKEKVGGKILYEVGYKVGEVDHAYILSESGDLVQEEADVEVSKLPAPVTAAVKKAEPEGKIDEAAQATAGDKHFYEVDVKVGKVTHAIKVTEDGTLIADEIETSVGAD